MELRHLRYFVAAAEEEHFSRAADRLCVSRPAVSQLISDLEEELGTQLFKRTARGVSLTAAGAVFHQRLLRVLGDLAQATEITQRVGAGKAGLLNIGYGSATLLHPLFQDAIKQLHSDYPEVALSLFEGPSVEQIEGLKTGRLQAGFIHTPLPDAPSQAAMAHEWVGKIEDGVDLARLPLQIGRLAAVLNHAHPLAGRKTLHLADLAQERFIVVSGSSVSPSYGRLAALCAEAGFEARVVQEVRNTAAQLNLVSIGIGVGLIIMLPGVPYAKTVKLTPLADIGFGTRFELAWARTEQLEQPLASLVGVVQRLAVANATPSKRRKK